MAIDLTPEIETLMNAYDIPWPDVDQDAFLHLEGPLRAFGADLDAVGDAIESALRLLASGNPSQTLQSLIQHVQAVRQDYLQGVNRTCDDLAGSPCQLAYDAIVALKVSLVGLLLGEVTNSVTDLVSIVLTAGADSAAALAEAAAIRELVSVTIEAGESEIVSQLLAVANRYLDDFVTSVVNRFVGAVEHEVDGAVVAYVPAWVTDAWSADTVAADRLHLSRADLEECIASLATSTTHLDRASVRLDAVIEEVFSRPAPVPDVKCLSSTLRTALREIVATVKAGFVAAIRTLIDHVIQHFTRLLRDYARAVERVDQDAREVAARIHAAGGPPVTAVTAAGVGVAAAARVAAASGLVNPQGADRVQVDQAVAVQEENSVTASIQTPGPVVEVVEAVADETQQVRPRTDAPLPRLTPPGAAGVRVESVTTSVDRGRPRVTPAVVTTDQTAPVAVHHEHQARATVDDTPAAAHVPADEVRGDRREANRPAVAAVQGPTAHGVREVAVKKEEHRPHVDGTLTHVEPSGSVTPQAHDPSAPMTTADEPTGEDPS